MKENFGIEGWQDLELHPLCDMFPPISEEGYEELKDSMNRVGFLSSDPIVVIHDEGEEYKILEGRNRRDAAVDTGVEPVFIEYEGKDATGFVVAKNLARRHLTAGQRAAIAHNLANLGMGQNAHTEGSVTIEDAAKLVGTSEKSVKQYRNLDTQHPELAKEVLSGESSLRDAYNRAKESRSENVETTSAGMKKGDIPASLTPDPEVSAGSPSYSDPTVSEQLDRGKSAGGGEAAPEPPKWKTPIIKVIQDRNPEFESDKAAPIMVQVGSVTFRLDVKSARHLGDLLMQQAEKIEAERT